MNVYRQNDSNDFANSCAGSSRKNSIRFGEIREFVKRRRNTSKVSRCPQLASSLPSESTARKISADSQFFELDDSDEERDKAQPMAGRRFSVPEKVFRNKDYAILRQSREHQLEVIAAFVEQAKNSVKLQRSPCGYDVASLYLRCGFCLLDKYTDPYREYMQSLPCYDLAPTHGSALLIDGDLSMRKSLLALNQSGHSSAMVISSTTNSPLGMITITDCLRAIVIALSFDPEIGDRSVHDFIKVYGKKKLITATVSMSVWDAARLICLNRVHRLPVFQTDESGKLTDLLYTLSLRRIFIETVVKLHRTLYDSGIGAWDDIVTISIDAYCGEAIDKFVAGKLSCIAVVDERNVMLGKISKNDIMRELIEHSNNYLEIVNVPVKDVYRIPPFSRPTNTIYEGITRLLSSGDHCLFIVDCNQRVMAAIEFIDIMDYILNSADIHHKMSVP